VKGTPRFEKVSEIRAVTQCGDLYLEAIRPTSMLVPSNADPANPAAAVVETEHELDHFLCYRAKAMEKLSDGTRVEGLTDGVQIDVTDAFQTRRYDLKRVTRLCTPLDKSGAPIVLSGPDKGTPKTICEMVRIRRIALRRVICLARPAVQGRRTHDDREDAGRCGGRSA
jgi:hypothetical protein